MDSKSSLRVTNLLSVLMLLLTTSALGYRVDFDTGSSGETDIALHKKPTELVSDSFTDLTKNIMTANFQLELMGRETEKRGAELNEEENNIEKQRVELKKQDQLLQQREEYINKTGSELAIREESIDKTQIEIINQEQRVKTLEEELKQKEKDIESQKAEIKRKIENFVKAAVEVAQKEQSLKVREEKLKQKGNHTTSCSVVWVESSGGDVPPNAIVGGRTSDGENLYVGRAWHNATGDLLPAKVNPSLHLASVSYYYVEYRYSQYEVATLEEQIDSSD